jgi:hypothetical protein
MSTPTLIPPPQEPTGFFLRGITGPTVEQEFTAPQVGRVSLPTVRLRCLQVLWTEPTGAVRVTELWLPAASRDPQSAAEPTPGQLLSLPVTLTIDPKTNSIVTALSRDWAATLRLVNPSAAGG